MCLESLSHFFLGTEAHLKLSGAFSGLLAAAIENMDGIGGRPGWVWIFILVGFYNNVFPFQSSSFSIGRIVYGSYGHT